MRGRLCAGSADVAQVWAATHRRGSPFRRTGWQVPYLWAALARRLGRGPQSQQWRCTRFAAFEVQQWPHSNRSRLRRSRARLPQEDEPDGMIRHATLALGLLALQVPQTGGATFRRYWVVPLDSLALGHTLHTHVQVTGRVRLVRHEDDGDVHLMLTGQRGFIVAECIP